MTQLFQADLHLPGDPVILAAVAEKDATHEITLGADQKRRIFNICEAAQCVHCNTGMNQGGYVRSAFYSFVRQRQEPKAP